jgi:class 3 adenylate cyclase
VSVKTLIEVLNDIFSRFDRIAERYGLEKIKTIGDCYMVASGLPVPVADHSERAANMALDMIEAMQRFNAENTYPLEVRIGLDSGPAVAGVIGRSKFLYDLWGDVVNTASRMESHGVPGRIQVTEAACERLQGAFVLEERGTIEVKGKGSMNTWFLNGRRQSPGTRETAIDMAIETAIA